MSVKDGFKFGIGYILGQAFMVALAKAVVNVCEKTLDSDNKENE